MQTAAEFFFAEDYFWGTNNMILYWRSVVQDLQSCSAIATGAAEKIKTALDNKREEETYWSDMVPDYE